MDIVLRNLAWVLMGTALAATLFLLGFGIGAALQRLYGSLSLRLRLWRCERSADRLIRRFTQEREQSGSSVPDVHGR